MKYIYYVSDMMCAACVSSIEKAVKSIDGVESVTTNLVQKRIYVEAECPSNIIEEKISSIGYTPSKVDINEVEIEIDGMSCAACASALEKALLKDSRIDEASVNFLTKKAKILSNSQISSQVLKAIVNSVGFSVVEKTEEKKEFPYIVPVMLCSAIVFILSMSSMVGIKLPLFDMDTNPVLNATSQLILVMIVMFFGR